MPHITVFDIEVLESAGSVTVNFQRTGGDLTVTSHVQARTVVSAGITDTKCILCTGACMVPMPNPNRAFYELS